LHKLPAARYFTLGAAQRDIGHRPFEAPRTICVDRLRQLLPNAPLCYTSKDTGCSPTGITLKRVSYGSFR
jgi:hypothetical protein